MSFRERSLDDMPLAAYSTGIAPIEEEEDEPVAAAATPASPSPFEDPDAHPPVTAEVEPAAKVGGRKGPRLSVKMPSLRRSKAAALAEAAPFQPVSQGAPAPGAFQPVHRSADPVPMGAAAPHVLVKSARRDPREFLRDPRILAGGAIAIGLVLLGVSLLGGGGPTSGGNGPNGSQGTGVAGSSSAPLGIASVELSGGATGLYTLNVATGAGPAVDSQVNATWTDALGTTLGLSGLASQGTRTTDINFVLSWTMLIDNVSVMFTSRDSECTIGMAVGPKAVHGTFNCKKLKSGDGKYEIDLKNGKYTT